jgi:hypothetical protein
MTDEDGVLGNLPRSRPGRRSEKRKPGAPAKASAAAAARAERTGARASKPARASEPRSTARPKPAAGPRRAAGAAAGEQQGPPRRDPDAVTSALRTVAGLAGGGARVANGVARELLRRLPRP